MRFVQPDVVRIELPTFQPDGKTKDWIEIKKELTKAEDARFRTRGFRRMSSTPGKPANGEAETPATSEIEIDWEAMALARVEAYLVDWSAKKPDGKDLPVTKHSIGALASDDFEAIDKAILAHMEALDAEKKLKSGSPALTATSPS